MAAGDLVVADWQLEYSGLLMGGDTSYAWVADTVGYLPTVRTSRQLRLRQDGAHAGDSFLGMRTLRLVFEVYESTEATFETTLQSLVEAFSPAGMKPLYIQKPGFALGRKVFIDAEPVRLEVPGNLDHYHRIQTVTVELECADPLYYDDNQSSVAGLQLAQGVGGLTWPLTWALDWGTFTSGAIVAVNNGSRITYPTFTFNGPLVNPKLENQTTGLHVGFEITLSASESLVVDAGTARTVLLNGTTNRYNTLTSTSTWFGLSPGGDYLRFSASSGSGTCDVTWSAAWA